MATIRTDDLGQLVRRCPIQEILFKPGSRFGYSNPAFIYLARIVEKITGDPWEVYVQKNIFARWISIGAILVSLPII